MLPGSVSFPDMFCKASTGVLPSKVRPQLVGMQGCGGMLTVR